MKESGKENLLICLVLWIASLVLVVLYVGLQGWSWLCQWVWDLIESADG